MPIIAGQITGSALSGSLDYTFLSNIPSGIVSGAAQVAANLPAGTVSSSGQVDYNSITNKLSGVVSSSTQIQPLLPDGTVSASNQVDITATTNYSTFSSSLATVDAGQTTRIDNLASLTSSYAINATIQGQLAGVASSSAQVKAYLPADTVSSSGQVDITATSGYSTFSSSIATKNDTQDVSIGALNAATSSYAINATIQGQLAGVVSSSTQVKPLLPGGTVSSSAQYPGWVTASSQIDVRNTTGIATIATTGSNTFNGTQTVTGSLFTSGSNSLVGSTTLSGSLVVSGAAITSTPNIQIYGDTEFTGYAKFNPVTSNIDTSISASYIYVSGSTQDLYFSQNSAGYNNVTRLRWLESNLYTGLLKGGILTTTTGSTTFNISAGEGIVVTLNASTTQDPYPTIKLVRWDAKTNVPITFSGSAKITYVGLDVAGNVIQQVVPWGSTDINQFDTQINLGVILHSSASISTGAYNAPQISYGAPQKADDFFRSFGPLKVSGHTLQASGSSPSLSIKKTAGTSYREGSNYANNPNHPNTVTEESDITISKIYRYYISGSTPVIDTGASGSGYPTLDNQNRVDTATGLLTSIGLSNWSIQRVFWVPGSPTNAFIVYYGNTAYSTLLNAVNAINTEPFTEAPDTAANAVFIGYIVIQGGSNRDLLNATDCTIIQAGLFRNIAGVGSGGTQPVATTLAGLSDVGISSPAIGDLLVYTGATWNNTKSLNGSYSLTGSLATNDGITAITINATAVSASLSGSGAGVFGVNYNTLSNIPAGIVSSSTQVQPLLPGGTVSSSAQYPGWVTSSAQIDITATTGYSTFSSSLATVDAGQTTRIDNLASQTSSYAINSTIQSQLAGVVSSSTQVKPLLPDGTVSSSAQYPGWVTASSQIDYNNITNKLSGVVSSSAQVVPLLPGGTVSSSGQVSLTATSEYSTFSSSIATKNDLQDVSINALNAATGSYAINATIQGQLAGVVSSSAQVKPLLPGGTVSSSGQVDITATTNYSTFSSSLATVDAGQTTRIDNLASLTSSYAINATIQGQLAGVVSSSTQVKPLLPGGTVSASNQVDITATTGYSTFSSSLATVDAGQTTRIDNLASLTSSYAINATIQGQLAGVVSSSTQVKPLLPGGTVSASGQVDITATTGYSTFSSSLATVDAGQTARIDNLASQTSSYAINATIQGQLAGVVSSSTQVKPLLPGGTVTSSAQYPGWVTASSQIDYNSIQNKLSGVVSSSTQIVPLLPAGTISASSQVALNAITGVTFSNSSFYFPNNLRVEGTLTAQEINTEYVSSSIIYESGSTKFGDTADDVMSVTGSIRVLGGNISGSFIGLVSSSAQIDYNSIQNKLSGVVSSSTQVQPLLPVGTVSSSAQYPGWVTSSTQIVWSSVNYNGGIVSSSAQVKPLLPDGTVSSSAQYPGWVTASSQVTITGISGLGANVATFLGTPSSANLATAVTDETGTGALVFAGSPTLTGTATANNIVMSGSQFSGIVSGSGLQYRLVVPVGTNQYAT
jgi:hypothetical protein